MIDLLFRGRSLVFDSPLSVDEIRRRLQREVSAPAWRFRDTRTQLFEGTFADDRFWMIRLVRGTNSCRPFIEGRLCSGARGTSIDVQLRLHPAVLIVVVILLTIGASVAAIAAQELLASPQSQLPYFVMVAPVLVLCVFVFATRAEGRKATRLLAGLFESEPSRPDDKVRGS